MKILLVSSRFPLPPYTGDRLRALIWLDALAGCADVTLVCPEGELNRPEIRHIAVRRSIRSFFVSLLGTWRCGLPLHSLIAAHYDWGRAFTAAGTDFDVAIVLLSRLDPWVFDRIRAPRLVLDAIDSLAMSVAERSREARGPMRTFWKTEVVKTAALEKSMGDRYDTIVVVSEDERALFGRNAVAVPNGVEIAPLELGHRGFDFGFWGRLSYFANHDAARMLLEELWPRIRDRCRGATLYIGGADSPGFVRAWNGREGVTVESPMKNRHQALRNVRTALFPISFGTGQSNKILEAGEAGCAIVSTPAGVRGLEDMAAASLVRDDGSGIVDAASSLFSEPRRATELGRRLREIVVAGYDRQHSQQRLVEIARGDRPDA